MGAHNANILYEPLFRQISSENNHLRRKVRQLEEEVDERDLEIEHLKEKLRQQEDTNQKLRTLLFKHPKPIHLYRPHEATSRTAESFRRTKPVLITERKTLVLETCPDCGHDVSAPQSERTRIIEDIVFHPQPDIVEWTLCRHWCSHCQKLVEGKVPGVLPHASIGPKTLTYVVLAKYRWCLPYAKIKDNLNISYGLNISEGEIAKLIERAAVLVGDKWQEIVLAVQSGAVVHCDETGWYVNGKKVWAHAFATDTAVLYEIIASRGKGVVRNMLGDGFNGVRVTDCLPNYKRLPGLHQICWAHLTREANENWEREPSAERRQMAAALNNIYSQLRHGTKDWQEPRVAAIKVRCQKKLKILKRQRWRDEACLRLVKRLDDYQHALFTCLDSPGIPPDNNHAERVLRKLVVQRKISGGNRSPVHALAHAKIMSVIETLRLEGGSLLPQLHAVLQQGMTAWLSRE